MVPYIFMVNTTLSLGKSKKEINGEDRARELHARTEMNGEDSTSNGRFRSEQKVKENVSNTA